MTVITSGTWPIDPTATSGTELAAYLNELVNAIQTTQASPTRPPAMQEGGIWSKTLGAADIALMFFDGTADHEIGSVIGGNTSFGGVTASATAPTPVNGDLWVDTSTAGKPQLKMYDGAAWQLVYGKDAFNIDASGNVGIGTGSPSAKLEVTGGNGTCMSVVGNGGQYQGMAIQNDFGSSSQDASAYIVANNENGIGHGGLLFTQAADGHSTTGMTVTRAGDRTSDRRVPALELRSSGANQTDLSIYGEGGGGAAGGEIVAKCREGADGRSYMQIFHNVSSQDGSWFMLFDYGASGTIGSISQNGTNAVAYNTSSDYRLKEDVQPMIGASDRLRSLKPVNFAWKSGGSRVDGFIAHQAQEVVPESVTGKKDAVDESGAPIYQGIDQSKLVPLLTASLQEALGKIDALETRITALEAKVAKLVRK